MLSRFIYSFLIISLIKIQMVGQELPIDKNASRETKALYRNLKKLLFNGCMIGQQDATAYGVGWKFENNRSDIKNVTGDHSAVYGFDLGHLELGRPVNLDSVPFEKTKQLIREAYDRGGVITISWHLRNPLTGKTAWNPEPGTVASILPGGSKNELFNNWLDKVAAFMQSLMGKKGEYIPVIFRPYHELNGSWFWWGGKNCTPDELKQLYRYTVTYLRDTKQVHQLLYAFNTDKFNSANEYLERYPGDEWVDLIGFDVYQAYNIATNDAFSALTSQMLNTLDSIAAAKNKIPAITEFGYNGLPDSTWWTKVLLPLIKKHKISYALAWRNADTKQFYMPYIGQASANDFIRFYKAPETLFQKEVTKANIYK
jgi:hypothetical protein